MANTQISDDDIERVNCVVWVAHKELDEKPQPKMTVLMLEGLETEDGRRECGDERVSRFGTIFEVRKVHVVPKYQRRCLGISSS